MLIIVVIYDIYIALTTCLYLNYFAWCWNKCLQLAILNLLSIEQTQAGRGWNVLSRLTEVIRAESGLAAPLAWSRAPTPHSSCWLPTVLQWSTGRQQFVVGLTLGCILDNKASSPGSSINSVNFGLSFNICRSHLPNVLRGLGWEINKYPSSPPVLFSEPQ